jgi:hypothetical protein
MLWKHYVFRRGAELPALWDQLLAHRPVRLLYIAGQSFDLRAQVTMNAFVDTVRVSGHSIDKSDLILVELKAYEISQELQGLAEKNTSDLQERFGTIGRKETSSVKTVLMSPSARDDETSASNALRIGTERVLEYITDQTDIILDASSLPRIAYLSLMTGLLRKLVPDKQSPSALIANGINFQVLVAEDASLDAKIQAEDLNNDLVLIPGFSSPLHAESVQDWPLVWFPILGENRVNQLTKIMGSAPIPVSAEICPVLPHPSRDPRRADRLLVEYRGPLFDSVMTPISNIMYTHEANPFETYRQIVGAMERYRKSMAIIGGCRLVVTPLGSKLICLGAGLACFEQRPEGMQENYGIAIPLAEPLRYVVSLAELRASKPELSGLLLTGDAYR